MRLRIVFVLLAAVGASSCGSVTAPSNNTTVTFSGTIEPKPSVKYIAFHQFTNANSGEVEVKITSLTPVSNLFVATFLGQPQSDGACAFVIAPNEFSVLNKTSISQAVNKGPYCTGIYDPGSLTQPLNYPLTVSHP